MKKIKEIMAYRQMLESLVLTDLRTRYKGSFFGFLWTLLNPLLMLMIYSLVFKYVMRVQLENYTTYLFIGLIVWTLLSQSILSGAGAIIRNSGLVKKIYFPREILPLSVVLGGAVNFLFSLLILIPMLIINNISLGISILLFPGILLIYLLFVLSITMIVSSINVYFRDMEHISNILVMAWFYITPIVYTTDMIPDSLQSVFNLNPMKVVISSFHDMFFFNKLPNTGDLIYLICVTILLLIISSFLFKKLSRKFAEEI
ncbi:ABC transporter permease [Paenibacillus sp. KS1]|uniref:ABC transporter permease n=1 Tax=Paenibacillus sp. KS1 TaxID=1849249 RepID=UPI000AAC39E6|nr:ABC transporter permease [Paenibacillus sp. KS1]